MNGATQNECIQLLMDAVRIRSLSGQEEKLARYLVRWAQEHRFDRAYVDEAGNAVVEMGAENAPHTIVLLGHMDTVPGDIPVRIEDGKLYGRGAVDAKGPLCTFLCAVRQLGSLPHIRFVVVGATEEEAATSRGARHIRDRFLQEGIPTACIIGEPSAWNRVTLGYKGRLLMTFVAKEASTHTAGPEAIGVADRACRWWGGVKQMCEEFNQNKDRAFDKLLPSLRDIATESDGLTNIVRARVGLRLPLDFDITTWQAQLQEAAQGVGGRVEFSGYEPAYLADRRTPLVRAFMRAIRTVGGKPGLKVKTGTSDMNVVGPAWRCPIVAYGPGDSSLDHTPNEHIILEEYERAIRVLTIALQHWVEDVATQ